MKLKNFFYRMNHRIRFLIRKYKSEQKLKAKKTENMKKTGLVCCLAVILLLGTVLFCVKNDTIRAWCYQLTHKEIIDKGIQLEKSEDRMSELDAKGELLTYYRFLNFGASNPRDVDKNAPMVALTFDDGPNPDTTTKIVEVLQSNYSSATFFVVGTNAEKYQETLQLIAGAGCEIGNHTYNHANLTEISGADAEEQIDKVNRAVKKATGEGATVIRPPYGAYDEDVLTLMQQPAVLWNLDTEDWESRNAQVIVDKVMSTVKDGDIILMHDIYDSTVEAVELLVPRLKEQGYQVLSVSDLAKYKGKELELHKAYGEISGATQ